MTLYPFATRRVSPPARAAATASGETNAHLFAFCNTDLRTREEGTRDTDSNGSLFMYSISCFDFLCMSGPRRLLCVRDNPFSDAVRERWFLWCSWFSMIFFKLHCFCMMSLTFLGFVWCSSVLLCFKCYVCWPKFPNIITPEALMSHTFRRISSNLNTPEGLKS